MHSLILGGYILALPFILFHLLTLFINTEKWKNKYKNSSSRGCTTKIKVAHRGFIEHHPENTIDAIIDAYHHGLMAEIDVEITSDEQLVIFHDATCHRMTENKSSLQIKKSSFSELSNVLIPQSIFGMQCKASSKIPLLQDALKEMSNIDNKHKAKGIYLDLKGHSHSYLASKMDRIYNRKLINTLSVSQFAKDVDFRFYFASFNAAALNDLLLRWNDYIQSNIDIVCQYQFVYYIGMGDVHFLEYFVLKTKIWHWFCPVSGFVCNDGLFNMYYDEIIKQYKKDNIKIGCWQKYHDTQSYDNTDIEIYNLPSESWKNVIKNGGYSGSKFDQHYTHKTALCLYQCCCIAVVISWSFVLSQFGTFVINNYLNYK